MTSHTTGSGCLSQPDRHNRQSRTIGSTTDTYTYDYGNQLATVNSVAITWDGVGGTSVDHRGNTFDRYADGSEWAIEDSSSALLAEIERDPWNRPVQVDDGGAYVTRQIWDNPGGDWPLVGRDENGAAVFYVAAEGILLGEVRSTGFNPTASDASGSLLLLKDEIIDLAGAFGDASPQPATSPQRYVYAGLRRIPDNPYQLAQHRVYDHDIGRFVSADPLGLAGGDHRFSYANGDPLRYVDPSGLFGERLDRHDRLASFESASGGSTPDYVARWGNTDHGRDARLAGYAAAKAAANAAATTSASNQSEEASEETTAEESAEEAVDEYGPESLDGLACAGDFCKFDLIPVEDPFGVATEGATHVGPDGTGFETVIVEELISDPTTGGSTGEAATTSPSEPGEREGWFDQIKTTVSRWLGLGDKERDWGRDVADRRSQRFAGPTGQPREFDDVTRDQQRWTDRSAERTNNVVDLAAAEGASWMSGQWFRFLRWGDNAVDIGRAAARTDDATDASRAVASGADDAVDASTGGARVTGDALAKARSEFAGAKKDYWRREAAANPEAYSADDVARLAQGKGPIGPDGYPMELHHKTPLAQGGANAPENLVPMTRTEHRLGDAYKANHPNLP